MSFNHYFQSELLALKELGQDFSEKNPALAPFLAQDSRDPDVERLFEGFAFITGRLRQKIDDELPELSHSLLQLLWPNYLRPIPSFGMIQFEPVYQASQAPVVPKAAELRANDLDLQGARFKTCYDTELSPVVLQDVNFFPQGEAGVLQIQCKTLPDLTIADLTLPHLRLHFHGDRSIASSLYFSVLHLTKRAWLVLKDSQGQVLEQLPLDHHQFKPVGFSRQERLLRYPMNCFDGYVLLQEYFCYPQKFLFVDIPGLSVLQLAQARAQAATFELQFELERAPMTRFQPKKEHVRLHCSPVANVFKTHAIPVRYDRRQTEYKVVPAEHKLDATSIVTIDSVSGWLPGDIGLREFSQFERFQGSNQDEQQAYYRLRYKPGIGPHDIETWLSFNNVGPGESLAETISVDMTCCDHSLAYLLREGDISVPGDSMPQYAHFKNIGGLSATYAPPMSGDTLWKIISNMSLNYQSMADVHALQVVLETYDFPGAYDDKHARRTRKMLQGIRSITQRNADRIWMGLPVRGICTDIELDVSHFLCEGDMYLFASVLNEFFSSFTSLNTFHQLQVKSSEGVVYSWAPRMSQQVLS